MKYKVLITDIAKEDIKEKKKYILRNFKYRGVCRTLFQKDKESGAGVGYIAGRHGLGEYYQTMDQQKTLNILRKESPDS